SPASRNSVKPCASQTLRFFMPHSVFLADDIRKLAPWDWSDRSPRIWAWQSTIPGMTKALERSITRTPAGAVLVMPVIRWLSIKMKTLFAIFPVLTSSNRPAWIATGPGVGEGVGLGEDAGVWACNAVDAKRENPSATVLVTNKVLFIGRRARPYSIKQ